MKRHADLVSRLLPGLALSLAVTGAGCGAAVDSEGPADDVRPEVPDVRPDLPGYQPDEDGIMRLRAAEGVLRKSKVRGTMKGGNATGVYECLENDSYPGYEHYEHGGQIRDTQLHVIGIYERAEREAKPIPVHINRPGRSVLVLSAVEGVTWNITVGDDTELERVIVSSVEAQVVNAPEGVPVLKYSYREDGEYLGAFGFAWPSYDTTDMVDAAELLTGLELTSFRGCYAGISFQVDEPGELRPPNPELTSPEPRIIEGCEALTEESSYCMATVGLGDEYTMLGLDSGDTCGAINADIDFTTSIQGSLAWLGDYLYVCWRDRGLTRISIADGSTDIASIPCGGVTEHDGGLLVQFEFHENLEAPFYLARFDSFADAVERSPDWLYEMAPYGSSISAKGDRVYFTTFYTDTVEVVDLSVGAEFQSIPLEGYEEWVNGMAVTDDGRIVIGGQATVKGLNLFDVQTGTFLGKLDSRFDTEHVGGMSCGGGGAAR